MLPRGLAALLWAALVCSACGSDDPSAAGADGDAAVSADQFGAVDSAAADGQQGDAVAEGWVPASTTDLYGAWESVDDGILRRYEFRFLDNMFADMSAATPAYRLLKGPVDGDLVLLERGSYSLKLGPILMTKPVWALDVTARGHTRDATFVPSPEPNSFSLEVLPGIRRVFFRVETYAFP